MDGQTDGIEVKELTVRRGGRIVLERISLSLTERRIGIIGQNGSGKSTLARALAGLQKPLSGTIRVDGIDPHAERRGLIDSLGILFQNPDHQIFMPTVVEELSFGLRQQGHDRQRAEAIAAEVLAAHGRADWLNRPVGALSEGQRRFLCLMSVLAMRPATILLDEPYAGLDLPTGWHLQDWLARLDQRLVLITHDPRTLARFDRVIWLDEGRVAREGPAEEIVAAYLAEMKTRASAAC